MKKYLHLTLIGLLLTFSCFSIAQNTSNGTAQELPEIVPPSPTVANLMKFEEVPVSYYTGQPNIAIPLYSKAINSELKVNVSLSYSTQGVKMDNVSGWTGTGWSLNAGGSISRTVRGFPDEILPSQSLKRKVGMHHLTPYWSYTNYTHAPNRREHNFRVLAGADDQDKHDSAPDLYQFSFMGYSGRFLVFRNGSQLEAKFITKAHKFKVEISHNSDYVINEFKITDPKGYKYTFDAIETSNVIPYSVGSQQGSGGTFNVQLDNYFANTAWHLKKVQLSNDEELLSIAYTVVNESYQSAPSVLESTIVDYGGSLNDLVQDPYNQGVLEPAQIISYNAINSNTQKITSITFTRDNTQIVFATDSFNHPNTNGKVLRSVSVKNGVVTNKTFHLNYQDIIGDPSSSILGRLWLTNVRETADNINKDYNLYYHYKENLPDPIPNVNNPNHTYYYQMEDDWGYFSGINVNQTYCNNIAFDENSIKTGLLTAIEYPSGGVKEFEFEHNTYTYYQDQAMPFTDYIQNPRNSTQNSAGNIGFSHTYDQSSNSALLFGNVVLDYEQDIYLSSTGVSGSGTSGSLQDYFIRIHGVTNGFSLNVETLNNNCVVVKNLPQGTYEFYLERYGVYPRGSFTVIGDFQVFYRNTITNPRQEMIGGGVRIKSIKFKDSLTATTNEKQLNYSYNDKDNTDLSSGVVDSQSDKLIKNYVKNTTKALYANLGTGCSSFGDINVKYNVRAKLANVALTQGNYIGYRQVKVFEQNNGFKTYAYTSPYDYPSHPDSFDFDYPKPRANIDYKRGLLLEEKIYNESGDILKEVSYKDVNGNPNYTFDEAFLFNDLNHFLPNDCSLTQFYDRYDYYANGTLIMGPCLSGGSGTPYSCGYLDPINTHFNSGWAKLNGNTTKEYFYDSQGTQTVKQYRQINTYNTENYQLAEQNTYYAVRNTEEHLTSKYYYPVGTNLGSNTPAVVNAMVTDNKVNEVLESQSFRNGTKTNETHNIYFDADNSTKSLMMPHKIEVGKGSSVPETRIEFLKYDKYGNPLEVKKANGTTIVYIYGFNGTVPVAKIVNAEYGDVSAVSGIDLTPSGNLLTAHENSIRTALPNAQVSFYRYDVLKGLLSISDERGYTSSFEYDAFNRLKYVKDEDGNILSENEYKYRTQN